MHNKKAAAIFNKLKMLCTYCSVNDNAGAPLTFYCRNNGWFVEHFKTMETIRFDTFGEVVNYIHDWNEKQKIPAPTVTTEQGINK